MNFNLSQIPDRILKPRKSGLTMVMDKGLSVNEAKNFMSVSHPHVDIVKLGFGTSFVTPNLEEKLEVYRSYDIRKYTALTIFPFTSAALCLKRFLSATSSTIISAFANNTVFLIWK
jgi:phosphosulfolactate synthase